MSGKTEDTSAREAESPPGNRRPAYPVALSALSGLLVYLSFPPRDLWFLAYVALVPLMVAVAQARSWKGAGLCGLVGGLLAYAAGLVWLADVSPIGWVGLALYLTLYLLALTFLLRSFRRGFPRAWPLLVAAAWVGLELIRAKLGTGFPWLFIGHTQYRFTALIQIAAAAGAYGVGFLVVLVNAAAAATILGLCGLPHDRPQARRPAVRVMIASLSALAACSLIGWAMGASVVMREGPRVGVVQQNVPRLVSQITAATTREKLCGEMRDEIARAMALSVPFRHNPVDMIVWPETTIQVPLNAESSGYLYPESQAVQDFAYLMLRHIGQDQGCHLLVGAPYLCVGALGDDRFTGFDTTVTNFSNSAYLFSPDGKELDRYDKIHLVPFGEYVPLRDKLPFLEKLTPMTRDLTPGKRARVFDLERPVGKTRFGVLICYEDVVPALVRKFRRRGAQFLVNMTDEGWYRRPGELKQHLPMAVFRAVETRTTVVRAANTGISCFINPRGQVYAAVQERVEGRVRTTNVEGAAAAPVFICDHVPPYVTVGDTFAVLCLVVAIAAPLILCAWKFVAPAPRKASKDDGEQA